MNRTTVDNNAIQLLETVGMEITGVIQDERRAGLIGLVLGVYNPITLWIQADSQPTGPGYVEIMRSSEVIDVMNVTNVAEKYKPKKKKTLTRKVQNNA